jgi:hypothetical protein
VYISLNIYAILKIIILMTKYFLYLLKINIMKEKKQRGRQPLPAGEKKVKVLFFIKEKNHGKFIKEIAPVVKKYAI